MQQYAQYTMLVSVWQIGIQVLCFASSHDVGFLGCVDGGWVWVYTSVYGSLFTMFHMMSILMQTIMVLKIFYLVPDQQGYFQHDATPKPLETNETDNDFVKA